MTKERLRAEFLARRGALPASERAAKSAAISAKLFDIPEFKAASALFVYASFGSEVDTGDLIFSGKPVFLPVTQPGGVMFFARFEGFENCAVNRFGILEPKGPPAEPGANALLIAPGVVFSKDGARIGYGKGYYDRYLAGRRFLPRIGICFACQLADDIPVSPRDAPMDIVLTEKSAYRVTAESKSEEPVSH
jgi:5-formyltetrahydrofolate cyclo-ligase